MLYFYFTLLRITTNIQQRVRKVSLNHTIDYRLTMFIRNSGAKETDEKEEKPLFRLSLFSFETVKASINYHLQKLSPPQKIIVFSVSAGVVLVSLVARYFRRKRVRKSALVNPKENVKYRKNKPLVIKSPSGEFHTLGGTISPGFHRSGYRHSSISAGSDRISLASVIPGTIISQSGKSSELTPQQYGVMGMESLEGAIGLWEEALSSYSLGSGHGLALPSQEAAEFTESLQKVIDNAYSLQDQCEHLFLHEHSVLFRSADISPNLSEAGYGDRRTLTSFSSLESFVSAQGDIADLRNLEEFEENPPTLYLSALKHHEEYGIPFRDVRTDRVKCGSDVEYICKVHCLRLASQHIFSFPTNKEWFAEAGRQVIECLLLRADKDPKDCLCAYDDFLLYLMECNWQEVENELKGRGVPAITFYD
ncbi:Mitoguardin, partial [Armadillidium nasatum]